MIIDVFAMARGIYDRGSGNCPMPRVVLPRLNIS